MVFGVVVDAYFVVTVGVGVTAEVFETLVEDTFLQYVVVDINVLVFVLVDVVAINSVIEDEDAPVEIIELNVIVLVVFVDVSFVLVSIVVVALVVENFGKVDVVI